MAGALIADEIRRLPPALTVVQAAALLGIGRSNAYHAAAAAPRRGGQQLPAPRARHAASRRPSGRGGVRLFSTSVTDYPRGGARPGPWICVPAVADRDGDRWRAAAVAAAGPLGGTAAAGETLPVTCDALASLLMVALEVGIDGMPEGWTGIMLFMLTRKTYPAAMLSAS